jgi:pimeloyl-ACP methyl ester carboxylesterase
VKSALRVQDDAQPNNPTGEFWSVVDGARMRYLQCGSGPALVLVHGLLGYSFSWRFAMPALSPLASVYAIDMLGSGFSDRPVGLDCSLRASAGRLLRFLNTVGITSCDLLGSSYGGAVVMMAAALAPDRVRRLILAAPVNPWSARGNWLAPILTNRIVAPLIVQLGLRREVAHSIVLRRLFGDSRRIRPGTLEGYSAPFRIPGTLEYAIRLVRSWKQDMEELESALPQIRGVPTLLVWGRLDAAVRPVSADKVCQQFADCRLVVFDGVGHLPYEEVPQEFNQAVIEFMSRTRTGIF